jgi:signal transduction histidine kinase/PAS domain-containing protein
VLVSADERAFASAALVQGLQADAPVGFAVIDEHGRYALISESLAAICGAPPEAHLGRTVAEVAPAWIVPFVERTVQAVTTTAEPVPGVAIDGPSAADPEDVRSWVGAAYPIEFAGRRLAAIILVDVTDRRRAEEQLRESERLLSGAQRMAGLGTWTFDALSETMTYAPELLSLMGRDPSLAGVPQRRDMLEFTDDEERRRILAEAHAAVRERRPFAARVRARRGDGEVRILDAHAELVHGPDGRPIGLHGFVQDITALERAAQRQRSLAELGQAALSRLPLEALLEQLADAILKGLGVEGAMVLERLPGGNRLARRAVRATGGWDLPPEIALEPDMLLARALASRAPVTVADWALEPVPPRVRTDARSSAAVRIGGGDAPFGVLAATSIRPRRFGATAVTFLQALADIAADAVERRRTAAEIAELAASRGRLVAQALDAEERARRTISETLHDGPLQELLAATHDLYALTGRGGDDAALGDAQQRLAGITRHLREVMVALHPTILQSAGLEAALLAVAEQQAHAGGFRTEVSVEPEATRHRDELLLSIARELLTNAAKHARARHVTVSVRRAGADVELEVADDGVGVGVGVDGTTPGAGHTGLAACRERMAAIGGELALERRTGGGTRALARAPVTGR